MITSCIGLYSYLLQSWIAEQICKTVGSNNRLTGLGPQWAVALLIKTYLHCYLRLSTNYQRSKIRDADYTSAYVCRITYRPEPSSLLEYSCSQRAFSSRKYDFLVNFFNDVCIVVNHVEEAIIYGVFCIHCSHNDIFFMQA